MNVPMSLLFSATAFEDTLPVLRRLRIRINFWSFTTTLERDGQVLLLVTNEDALYLLSYWKKHGIASELPIETDLNWLDIPSVQKFMDMVRDELRAEGKDIASDFQLADSDDRAGGRSATALGEIFTAVAKSIENRMLCVPCLARYMPAVIRKNRAYTVFWSNGYKTVLPSYAYAVEFIAAADRAGIFVPMSDTAIFNKGGW